MTSLRERNTPYVKDKAAEMWIWLRRGDLKRVTESWFIGAQDRTLATNAITSHLQNINKSINHSKM